MLMVKSSTELGEKNVPNLPIPHYLTAHETNLIVDQIQDRQKKFKDETFLMSVGVVLLNFGDKYVKVRCVREEWSGIKDDLIPRDGIPLCPNGHPLFEISKAPRLALIDAF